MSTFLQAADRIGARLCRDALWAGAECNWLGSSMEFVDHDWRVVERAFGGEVYNGTSGIALFLARLWELTGELHFQRAARGALQLALSRTDQVLSNSRIGFYSGVTGIAYTAFTLGGILDEPQWQAIALRLLESLLADNAEQQDLDVISGSAGAIPALLALHDREPRDFLMSLALRHGEHLLHAARRAEAGWSWNTLRSAQGRDLTGLSHGTSGIAWAFLELYRVTREQRFRQGAEQALAYERHWYSSREENWPDFRGAHENGGGEPGYGIAWCHGAPGIGLARLRAWEILGESMYRDETQAALRTTCRMLEPAALGSQNYSLCHGMAGNAELPLLASEILGEPAWRRVAENVGRMGIESFANCGMPWPCGVLNGGETPNLMLGLAGIGYFYLRLHDPRRIPPVLLILPRNELTPEVASVQSGSLSADSGEALNG